MEFETGGAVYSPPPQLALMARLFTSGQGTKALCFNGQTGAKLWDFETVDLRTIPLPL